MDAVPPIPSPVTDDDEDVHWALSTASALWSRGERAEALKWLRRAAETASDANADARALELFKAAAEVATKLSVVPPPDEPPRMTASSPPTIGSSAPPPAVNVQSLSMGPRTAVSPGPPPPAPSSSRNALLPSGTPHTPVPQAVALRRANPAFKQTVTLASPTPSGPPAAKSTPAPPLAGIAVTGSLGGPARTASSELVAPPLVPREPRPQSVRSGTPSSPGSAPAPAPPPAPSPRPRAVGGPASAMPYSAIPHSPMASTIPAIVGGGPLGGAPLGGGAVLGASSQGAPSVPTRSTVPEGTLPPAAEAEARRRTDDATRVEPGSTRGGRARSMARPVDDEVTIQKDFSAEHAQLLRREVRFDDLEEETTVIPGRQQLGRVLLAVDPTRGEGGSAEGEGSAPPAAAGAAEPDFSSVTTDPEATPEGEDYAAVIAAAVAASEDASRAAPVEAVSSRGARKGDAHDVVPSTLPAAEEAAVASLRVAVLVAGPGGEVRIEPLARDGAVPPRAARAILVPISDEDGAAIAAMFGSAKARH